MSSQKKPHILLGLTGSVATIKHFELALSLSSIGEVRIVYTRAALHFIKNSQPLSDDFTSFSDDNEWNSWKTIGDPVLHIDLRNWADIFLIAPLDANTLAKMTTGICDNLLTCIVRAWNNSKRLLIAPAMNTAMWEADITMTQNIIVIPPVEKKLACGDIGVGAMASVATITNIVKDNILN